MLFTRLFFSWLTLFLNTFFLNIFFFEHLKKKLTLFFTELFAVVLGLAGRERQHSSWELQGGQELLFFCSCIPHHGYGALVGRPASVW